MWNGSSLCDSRSDLYEIVSTQRPQRYAETQVEIMSAILVEPDPVQLEQPSLPHAEPCVVVIFGATGDLTKRKLMPALCRLLGEGCLDGVRVLGVGRSDMTDDMFRAFVREALDNSKKIKHLDEQEWREFAERLHYLAGELDQRRDVSQSRSASRRISFRRREPESSLLSRDATVTRCRDRQRPRQSKPCKRKRALEPDRH